MTSRTQITIGLLVATVTLACSANSGEPELAAGELYVGVASVDITPTEPIRLAGNTGRMEPTDSVEQRLWAKAIAFGDAAHPTVLVTADLVGISAAITAELGRRLESVGVKRDQLVLTATHTHTGPEVRGVLPTHLVEPRTPALVATIDRYTDGLIDHLEEVALEALAERRPSRVEWALGSVGFAENRRVLKDGNWVGWGFDPTGPVDHDLPVMKVSGRDGTVRAVLLTYACHAATRGGNAIHGDWPGTAKELIEARHPGATAIVTIGTAADANPNPRGGLEAVEQHAKEIADEVDRLIAGPMEPVTTPPAGRYREITLDFDSIPSRQTLAETARGTGRPAIHARYLLSRLDRGEDIGRSPYPIQTWTFGDDLEMIFLGGEAVADYGLRLKRELDSTRVWVTSYANAQPFYVASERMIPQGGYEVEQSMLGYGQASRLANGTEDRIIGAVRDLVPPTFTAREASRSVP